MYLSSLQSYHVRKCEFIKLLRSTSTVVLSLLFWLAMLLSVQRSHEAFTRLCSFDLPLQDKTRRIYLRKPKKKSEASTGTWDSCGPTYSGLT